MTTPFAFTSGLVAGFWLTDTLTSRMLAIYALLVVLYVGCTFVLWRSERVANYDHHD